MKTLQALQVALSGSPTFQKNASAGAIKPDRILQAHVVLADRMRKAAAWLQAKEADNIWAPVLRRSADLVAKGIPARTAVLEDLGRSQKLAAMVIPTVDALAIDIFNECVAKSFQKKVAALAQKKAAEVKEIARLRLGHVLLDAIVNCKSATWLNPFTWGMPDVSQAPKLNMNDPNYKANLQQANQMAKDRESQLDSKINRHNIYSGLLKGIGDTALFGLHRLHPYADGNITKGEGSGYAAGVVGGLVAPAGLAKGLGWLGKTLGSKLLTNVGKIGSPLPVNQLLAKPAIQRAAVAAGKETGNASEQVSWYLARNNPMFTKRGIPVTDTPNIALQNAEKAYQRAKMLYPTGAALADGGLSQITAHNVIPPFEQFLQKHMPKK